jgi:hypothetical protein
MVDAEMIGAGTRIPDAIVLKIIDTVADPFLITALVVVVLMFFLLRRAFNIIDHSVKDMFIELRAMSKILTETVTTNKVLTDIIVRLRNDEEDK